MTEPFVAQIQPFAFPFAPRGWALCLGQIMPISQNTALFSLLGVGYGGNGTSNFGLPNLAGSVVVGAGQGAGLSSYSWAEPGGESQVTLTISELATHNHGLMATTSKGTVNTSANNQLASGSSGSGKSGGATLKMYSAAPTKATTTLPPTALSMTGGNGPHNNMQPYLALNFCIALSGQFPQRP